MIFIKNLQESNHYILFKKARLRNFYLILDKKEKEDLLNSIKISF